MKKVSNHLSMKDPDTPFSWECVGKQHLEDEEDKRASGFISKWVDGSTTKLTMKNMGLTRFPRRLLHYRTLEMVDLSHNEIEALPYFVHRQFSTSKKKDKSVKFGRRGTTGSEVPPSVAAELLDGSYYSFAYDKLSYSITSLSFAHNRLSKIDPGLLQLLVSSASGLRSLNISYNPIEDPSIAIQVITANLPCLQHLHLSGIVQTPLSHSIQEQHAMTSTTSWSTSPSKEAVARRSTMQRGTIGARKMCLLPLCFLTCAQTGMAASLHSLSLAEAGLNEFPLHLTKLSNLTALDLSFNFIHLIPTEIGTMSNIRELSLHASSVSKLPEEISLLSKLEVLVIDNNSLRALPDSLVSLNRLQKLSLSHNNFERLPTCLLDLDTQTVRLPSLELLDIRGCPFSPEDVDRLDMNGPHKSLPRVQVESNPANVKRRQKKSHSNNRKTTYTEHESSMQRRKTRKKEAAEETSERNKEDVTQVVEVDNILQTCLVRYLHPTTMDTPDLILPIEGHLGPLYLGCVSCAQNKHILFQYGIKSILTVAAGIPPIYPVAFTYKVVSVEDEESQELIPYVDECVQYIHDSRAFGGVLVHCAAGVSRSATIVIAYMMISKQMNVEDAIEYVRNRRNVVDPNLGFLAQLHEIAQTLQPKGCTIS